MEDQLDSLTSMLQEALKTESMDSIPTDGSASSQYSTGSVEGNGLTSNLPGYQTGYRSRMRSSDSGTESMSSNDNRPASPFTSGTFIFNPVFPSAVQVSLHSPFRGET